jgi:hypothetical protein
MLLQRALRGAASAAARQLRHGAQPGSVHAVTPAPVVTPVVAPSVTQELTRRRCRAEQQGSAASSSTPVLLQRRRGFAADSSGGEPAATEVTEPPLVRGEKDAHGRALLDPRTLAFLSARGFGPPPSVEALLRQRGNSGSRFPLETAVAAHTWFTQNLGSALHNEDNGSRESNDVTDAADYAPTAAGEDAPLCAVDRMLRSWPTLLTLSAERLEENWAFMQAPPEAGGIGLPVSRAACLVLTFPQFFSYTPARMRARVAQLEALGVKNVPLALSRHLALLSKSPEGLEAKCALLRRAGLDAGKLVSAQPALLSCSVEGLAAKLSFLYAVTGCTAEDVQHSPVLLLLSLARRTRPRFFVALQHGVGAPRYKLASCVQPSDAHFIARMLHGTRAAAWSVEQYKAHVASPAFHTWAAEREAELRARHGGAQ